MPGSLMGSITFLKRGYFRVLSPLDSELLEGQDLFRSGPLVFQGRWWVRCVDQHLRDFQGLTTGWGGFRPIETVPWEGWPEALGNPEDQVTALSETRSPLSWGLKDTSSEGCGTQAGKEQRGWIWIKNSKPFPTEGHRLPPKGKSKSVGEWESRGPMQNAIKCSWSYSFFSLKYL